MKKTTLDIDVYGCTFRLHGDGSSAVHMVAQDFQFFICDKALQPIDMELVTKKPPYDEVPEGIATTYTPRNVSFTKNAVTYIDYSGEALAIWDRKRMRFRLFTTNPDLQYEAAYLFMLSRIGECLDGRKMHRIHAMAMSVQGHAVLAVLPMGGGKSTLTSGLLS